MKTLRLIVMYLIFGIILLWAVGIIGVVSTVGILLADLSFFLWRHRHDRRL